MPRQEIPFDPAHVRCIHPEFGRRFSEVLAQSGKNPVEVAKAIDVSPEIVRGYRRGFARPSPQTQKKLEAYFGASLEVETATEPEEIMSLPTTLTVQRHPSGDFLLTFRVKPDQLQRFLAK